MNGYGFDGSAKLPATPARRPPAAPCAPPRVEPGPAANQAAQSRQHPHGSPPPTGYAPPSPATTTGPTPERNQTDRHDQDALDQLAELSWRMTPWDAAMETFGGDL